MQKPKTENWLREEFQFIDPERFELKTEIQHIGCPFCEIDDGKIVNTAQTRQGIFYKFKRCNRCFTVYAYPRPNQKVIESRFTCDSYSESSKKFEGIENISPKHYKEFLAFTKKGDRVLDIGSGNGIVAEFLIKKGCNVEAVEINAYRASFLRKKGLTVYEGRFEDMEIPHKYDVIIFSQVLMHLFSVKKALDKTRRLLLPDGLIISSQMNFNAISQKTIRGPYPGKRSAFAVCSWFTEKSLKKILAVAGFEVIHTRFRPSGLLQHLFVEGYPAKYAFLLTVMEKVISYILVKTKTTDYFSVVAKKV